MNSCYPSAGIEIGAAHSRQLLIGCCPENHSLSIRLWQLLYSDHCPGDAQAVYIERDRLELQEIRRRIPPPMQQYYLQVRHRCSCLSVSDTMRICRTFDQSCSELMICAAVKIHGRLSSCSGARLSRHMFNQQHSEPLLRCAQS